MIAEYNGTYMMLFTSCEGTPATSVCELSCGETTPITRNQVSFALTYCPIGSDEPNKLERAAAPNTHTGAAPVCSLSVKNRPCSTCRPAMFMYTGSTP